MKNKKSLIVIVLIIALGGVLLFFFRPPRKILTEESRVAIATMEIEARWATALELYKIDNGVYPTTEQGLEALIAGPEAAPVPESWKGPYIQEKKGILDPWRRPYKYACPGEDSRHSYDLFSAGSDGIEGTEDDIVNRR